MARCGLASAGVALAVAVWCSSGVTADAGPPLTVIGDSVLTAVIWNQTPLSILEQGFDVRMEVGVCRTLTGESCPFEGARVPTLLELVHTLGPQLGPNVLVEVGYNDAAKTFAQGVEQSVAALDAAGARRIFWVNLHEWQPQYAAMNRVLDEAASRHPEMTILDWRTYSRNQWSWFQGDGVHLMYAGAVAMATFLHASVNEALSPLAVSFAGAPSATVGQPYEAQLNASGGIPPYRFSEAGVRLKGLRLLASGRLYGTPTTPGRIVIPARVTDSFGYSVNWRVMITVDQPNP
jgi:hypothetical protein